MIIYHPDLALTGAKTGTLVKINTIIPRPKFVILMLSIHLIAYFPRAVRYIQQQVMRALNHAAHDVVANTIWLEVAC